MVIDENVIDKRVVIPRGCGTSGEWTSMKQPQ